MGASNNAARQLDDEVGMRALTQVLYMTMVFPVCQKRF